MIGEIRKNFTEASASVGLILATVLHGKERVIRELEMDFEKSYN